MSKLCVTDPEYVDAVGSFAEFQKARLINYATKLGKKIFNLYEEMQQIREIEFAQIHCNNSFQSSPQNENIEFIYSIYGDINTKTISLVEVFIKVSSWTFLKFQIKKDDSNVDANGKKESVQGELLVHDESSDQRI